MHTATSLLIVFCCIVVGVVQSQEAAGFTINGLTEPYSLFIPNSDVFLNITAHHASVQFVNLYNETLNVLVNNQSILEIGDNITQFLPIVPFGVNIDFVTLDGKTVTSTSFPNTPLNNFQILTILANGTIDVQNPIHGYLGIFNSTGISAPYSSSCTFSIDNTFIVCTAFDTDFDYKSFSATVGQQFDMILQTNPPLLGLQGLPVPLQPGELQLSPFYYSIDSNASLTQETTHVTVNGVYNTSDSYQCLFAFDSENTTHTSPLATPKDAKTLQCEVIKSTLFGKSFKDEQQKVIISVVGLKYAGSIENGLYLTYKPIVQPNNHYMWFLIGGGAGIALIVVIVVLFVIKRNRHTQYSQI